MRQTARLAAIERALPAMRRPLLLWLDWCDDAVRVDGQTFARADGEAMDSLVTRAVEATGAAHPDRRVIVFSWVRP